MIAGVWKRQCLKSEEQGVSSINDTIFVDSRVTSRQILELILGLFMASVDTSALSRWIPSVPLGKQPLASMPEFH